MTPLPVDPALAVTVIGLVTFSPAATANLSPPLMLTTPVPSAELLPVTLTTPPVIVVPPVKRGAERERAGLLLTTEPPVPVIPAVLTVAFRSR